ncbi:MAG: protein-export membrane protein SecF [Patescibacteria group bacterium]|nr:MAG: protein-export membrane protein SecF [Patescibacteria group bacterium]
MLDIIGKRNWYFFVSLLVIIPGVISLFLYGLKLSVEFTGGSRMTLIFPKEVNEKIVSQVRKAFAEEKVNVYTIQPAKNSVIIRTEPLQKQEDIKILSSLEKEVGKFKQESFETIGPTIGKETTRKAFYSVMIASVLIVLYIALSFRKVPKPASSWRFGITAIIAVLHDVLLLVGIFSLLGHFYNVEIDSLFITALLTIIGFSVHDTIVVFDRIRENLLRVSGVSFEKIVNDSILQTIVRSLNTSLTALLVLFSLLLFGGESIRWFIVALFIGILSGTYSSIFNAAPLLVVWHNWAMKKREKSNTP